MHMIALSFFHVGAECLESRALPQAWGMAALGSCVAYTTGSKPALFMLANRKNLIGRSEERWSDAR